MLKIGILGTRGIPNHYGGFEQLAAFLSVGLVQKGHEVTVYNSHKHPYQSNSWKNVNIIHCYDPEYKLGTAGQFIYDLNCTLDARKRKFDVLLILGYTSSSVWGWLYPKETVCINHMDGLEWMRQKYGLLTRQFLKYAERLAIRFSRFFIADAWPIRTYLDKKYHIESEYIAYGADIIYKEAIKENPEAPYYLLMARMEKENNIEMILDGMHESDTANRFLVVGNTNNSFGRYLLTKYRSDTRIHFAGSIYEPEVTAGLKTNCQLYFHGHSVGGTNPSLLEAMAAGVMICAHDNPFNRSVLEENGIYFSSPADVKKILEDRSLASRNRQMVYRNLDKVERQYNWPAIIDQYDQFFQACYNHGNT